MIKNSYKISLFLITILLSLSCGSKSGSKDARVFQGSVDAHLINSEVSGLEIWALDLNENRIRKGSFEFINDILTYSIIGLEEGKEYNVVIYKETGLEQIEILSTVLKASVDSGASLSKSKVSSSRQINIITTYVRNVLKQRKLKGETTSVQAVLASTFYESVTSLEDVYLNQGVITINGSTRTVISDPLVKVITQNLALNIIAMTSMDSNSLVSVSETIKSYQSKLLSADSTSLMQILTESQTDLKSILEKIGSSFSSLVEAYEPIYADLIKKISSTDLLTSLNQLTAKQTLLINNALVNIYSIKENAFLPETFKNSLVAIASSETGLTEAILKSETSSLIQLTDSNLLSDSLKSQAATQAATGGSNAGLGLVLEVDSFGLAHETYGSYSSGNYLLNSLAPVFKMQLKSVYTGSLTDAFDWNISLAGKSQFVSSNLIHASDDDNKTFFLMFKSGGESILSSGNELMPGLSYEFQLNSKDTYTLLPASGVSLSGNLVVSDVTFTLPFDAQLYDISQINLNSIYTGLPVTSTLFNVNTKYPIQYTTSSSLLSDYGLLSVFPLDVSSVSTRSGTTQNIKFTDLASSSNIDSLYVNAYSMSFAANIIETGLINISANTLTQYTDNEDIIPDGNIVNWTIPKTIYIEKQ